MARRPFCLTAMRPTGQAPAVRPEGLEPHLDPVPRGTLTMTIISAPRAWDKRRRSPSIEPLFLVDFDVLGSPATSIAASPKVPQNHYLVLETSTPNSQRISTATRVILRKFPSRSSVLTSATWPSFSSAQRRFYRRCPASPLHRLAGRIPLPSAVRRWFADLWPRDLNADVGRRFSTASRSPSGLFHVWRAWGSQ